jgi:hypothetical protein
MQPPWEEWTDEALADAAQSGLAGQGATVEAIRRLREAVRQEQHATTMLTWVLVVFAVIQAAALVFQIYRQFSTP